jgi:hypothetical protein
MKEEWLVVGYDYQRNCDILEYYENGILQFSFYGYRNDKAGAWRVYPRSRGTYCYKKPNVSVVYYHEARKALTS